jgi:hypothetical protein
VKPSELPVQANFVGRQAYGRRAEIIGRQADRVGRSELSHSHLPAVAGSPAEWVGLTAAERAKLRFWPADLVGLPAASAACLPEGLPAVSCGLRAAGSCLAAAAKDFPTGGV